VTLRAIFLLAVGLAMDATAASVAQGLRAPRILPRHVLLVAFLFGGFQALMPLLGWLLGSQIGPAVQAWDHWIAFGLLGAIGAKMLWEAKSSEALDPDDGSPATPLQLKVLLVLAVATSIDAFAAGVTLPVMKAPLGPSLAIIGVTTAVLSALGLLLGRRFAPSLGRRLDVVGGLMLIGLGTKILVEHLSAS